MKALILFAIFIFYYGLAFAQETTPEKTNQIKISPLKIINLVNPGFEISYEKTHAEKFSSQISVALMNDVFKITPFTNYKGFSISFEEKFFKKSNEKKRSYYSVEPAYLNVNYFYEGTFKKDTALSSPEYGDTFKVAKQTFCLNFKYGVQFYLNRFIIDASIGLGIKYKVVSRSGLINSKAYEVKPIDVNAYSEANRAGSYFVPNLPVNIKIGYRF